MRIVFSAALTAGVILFNPGTSHAQTSIDGFGAVSMNQLSSFGDSTFPVDFGGRVSVDLTSNVQAIGEFGRLGNVLPEARRAAALVRAVRRRRVRLLRRRRHPSACRLRVRDQSVCRGHRGHRAPQLQFWRAWLNIECTGADGAESRRSPRSHGGRRGWRVAARRAGAHRPRATDIRRFWPTARWPRSSASGQDLRSHQARFGVGVRF